MNVILLSPYFPANYYQFAVALQRFGVNVLGLGDQPYTELAPALAAALTEYYYVNDLHNYDQLLRACGYFTHNYGKLDRIESHNEYWLQTDARLRTDFNVPGPKTKDMDRVKCKSKMKKVFQAMGVPVAPGKVMHTLREARKWLDEIGYPIVAKPDIGVGAAATYKIHNDAELQHFFEEKPPVNYFLEAFITGKLFSFDGLTDQDGNIVFYTSHFFSQGIMETVNQGLDMYYYSLRDIPAELQDAGMRAVKAFDVRERFFHIEFFHTDAGWVALEINMRPPGGLTMDMFNFANNINLYNEWASLVVYNRFTAQYNRPYHCAHVGVKRHLPHQLSHAAVLYNYAPLIVHHEQISSVLAPAIGDYGYLLRSPDLAELQAAIEGILAVE